jgi:hydroxymethylbilane synthase
LIERRPDLKIIPIRGNVPTRLQKLAEQPGFDALVLAAAGLDRLHFQISPDGRLSGDGVPEGLLATRLEPEEMLPCVGQGALGIEVRAEDGRIASICERLNHYNTQQCVTAERAFLKAMGGGCQIPVAAYADVCGQQLRMRAVSFLNEGARRGDATRPLAEAVELGLQVAAQLKP